MVVHPELVISRASSMQGGDGLLSATGGTGTHPFSPESAKLPGTPRSGATRTFHRSPVVEANSPTRSNSSRFKSAFGHTSPTCGRNKESFYSLIASYPRSDTFELNGNLKVNLSCKDKISIYNLTSPDCVFKNLNQIAKYNGKPWFRPFKIPPNSEDIDNLICLRLHAELENFYKLMKPVAEDVALRKATFSNISNVIRHIPNLRVESVKYYGSFSSHTFLPVSDIDLVVFTDVNLPQSEVLQQISHKLFFIGLIDNSCDLIPNSRIPLLKFHDSITGFPINITINTPKVLDRSRFIRNEIQPNSYLIKILYFFKYYLLHKGTNQVYLGGIGSYSLSLMVIRYFQEPETQELIEKQSCREGILGRLFLGFLKRFTDIDFLSSHIITVRDGGGYISCTGVVSPGQRKSILQIQDHLEPWKYTSSGSYNSIEILKTWGKFYNAIMESTLEDLQDPEYCLLNLAVTVIDDLVDYRILLNRLCKDWVRDDKFESGIVKVIQDRNLYRPRKLRYSSDKDEKIKVIVQSYNPRRSFNLERNNPYYEEEVEDMSCSKAVFYRSDINPAERRANIFSMNASMSRFNSNSRVPHYALHHESNGQIRATTSQHRYSKPNISHYGDFQPNSQQYNRKPRRNMYEHSRNYEYRVPNKPNLSHPPRSNWFELTGNSRTHFDPNSTRKTYQQQGKEVRYRSRQRVQPLFDPPNETKSNSASIEKRSPRSQDQSLLVSADMQYHSASKSSKSPEAATKAIKLLLNINMSNSK